MIIDAHSHVSDSTYGNVELLIKELDKANVDKCIVVPGGMMDVRKMTLYVTGDLEPNETIPNNVVYNALKKYPDRLKGYVCVNPLDEDNALKIFLEGVDNGCVGVKLSPMTHKFSFADEVLDEIAKECAKRNMPIYSHSLFNPGASTEKYGQLAKRHPDTNFILGHMGFGPADVKAMDLATELPNFYLETSSGCLLTISEAISKAGAEKIIFGSEFPMNTPKTELVKIMELNTDKKDLILYKNIQNLVPSLKK
ncbi:MAG: hypothetical protein A2086_16125 [Spirochaetes bacterium GWD1_27_9]|nr:MAG: hypothetical protein A2Z98_07035 [Spirochaetes bacterium GWB1_27_13]OHD21497.1 MAG: hypothetical protein A2Y34_01465 [Spirochaetes bacterium GWC1_27_15]OHD44179.1 MAG: hypothetical protein A2086_16125 [Spirochaetes bacterium GWD1_27_9]